MDLFQWVPPSSASRLNRGQQGTPRSHVASSSLPRQVQSVDREIRGQQLTMRALRRPSLPAQRHRNDSNRSHSSSGGEGGFKHWGSSLSIESGNSVGELTRRTLAPPSPSTLRRKGGAAPPSGQPPRRQMPVLPDMNVEVESPKLADYLAKPRLVSTLGRVDLRPRDDRPSEFHARRLANNERPAYRNLRFGGFMDQPPADDEVIPEVLRQYYLDTYLNVCDACESQTHHNPTSPIQRGM